jgi:hypothetical protein
MSSDRDSELFQALVLNLVQAAWAALGKIANPMTGIVERDLAAARQTLDLMGALETRTRGNLSESERALFDRTLRDLRLNYVDELKREESQVGQEAEKMESEGGPAGTEAT